MISCYDFEKNNKASDIFNDIAILEEIEKKVLELQNLVKESQKKQEQMMFRTLCLI